MSNDLLILCEVPNDLKDSFRQYLKRKSILYNEYSSMSFQTEISESSGKKYLVSTMALKLNITEFETSFSRIINYLKLKSPEFSGKIYIRKIFSHGDLTEDEEQLRQQLLKNYQVIRPAPTVREESWKSKGGRSTMKTLRKFITTKRARR